MARFSLNEGTYTLITHYFESPRCKSLCIAAGLEGEIVGIVHTHPVCSVFFIPEFDQLVRDPPQCYSPSTHPALSELHGKCHKNK